ncbi:NAD(P)-dependent oxidoreductase [Microvirga alba]|uniref:NAD(P)-dependent oxidoreductase n=1 Tax=Microvirga alba TaxID=2791025 RepID=A0A931BXY2_9HYPH|nr:NAD(P)-dependent oxidoreductase [Microvirga alba]MBF9234857.1 NAD(P)-dependent oxidoreductase [Microvirga alba]
MTAVGMIGLGQIGLPMAQNLLKGGHTVIGYRRSDQSELIAAGGIPASSPREVAERCSIILSCLPDDAALESVVSGPQGLASASRDGLVLVELSTLDTGVKSKQARALMEKGGQMLDCAVSGIPRMVRERQGVIYASGDEMVFERVREVLSAVAERVFFFGEFGNATKAKLTANILVALNIMATAEAMAFGIKAGLDPDRLIGALQDGAGSSLQFKVRAPVMAAGAWDRVMAPTAMLVKDIHLITATRERLGCPTPLLDQAAAIYEAAISAGYGETDVASVFAVVAERAGIQTETNKKAS